MNAIAAELPAFRTTRRRTLAARIAELEGLLRRMERRAPPSSWSEGERAAAARMERELQGARNALEPVTIREGLEDVARAARELLGALKR